MFEVKPVENGYRIEWISKGGERDSVPLAYEWDKIYTGSSAQSNAHRRRRQLNRLVKIHKDLLEVGAGWWAGPYKTGRGMGQYYICPNRSAHRQEELLGFDTLDALEGWIKQQFSHARREQKAKEMSR